MGYGSTGGVDFSQLQTTIKAVINNNLLGTICRNDVLHAIDKQLRANLKSDKEHAAH